MLVREGLIDGNVVVSPREMSRCSRLLTCARTACNAVHMDVTTNDASLQSGQHSELDASGKAARIREMLAAFYR